MTSYLDEIERDRLGTDLVGFTGGEPFMNRELPAMLEDALSRGFVLVLNERDAPHASVRAAAPRTQGAIRRRTQAPGFARPLHERTPRTRAGRAELGPFHRRAEMAGVERLAVDVAGRLYSGKRSGS